MDADWIAARNTESAELLLSRRFDRLPALNFQPSTVNFGDHSEVSLFSMEIALMTRPRQILQVVRSPMLPRYDVLDVKRMEGIVRLPQPAIFAAVECPLPSLFTRLGVHQEAAG